MTMTDNSEAVPRVRPAARRPMNDTPAAPHPQEVTAPDRYAKEVELGITKFMETCAERDRFKRLHEDEVLRNKQLEIDISNARETERLHVQTLVAEAVTAQSKAEAEAEVLRGEITRLQREMQADRDEAAKHYALLRDQRNDAVARAGMLEDRLALIRSAVDTTIGPKDELKTVTS